MKKIATLGPKGTFSDAATKIFLASQTEMCEVKYYSSIKKALDSLSNETDYGVLPIENLSEGFVSLVLDHLIDCNLSIISEILLPIQFSFVGNTEKTNIKRLHVQFVAKGQCSDFIDTLGNVEVVTTDSNIESLEKLNQGGAFSGAIVPLGSYDKGEFPLIVENVNDLKNNQTRFLVFSARDIQCKLDYKKAYKTSIIVIDDNDHPGLLEKILSSFTKRAINLTSIVSRPSGQMFGKYHFFIDFDGHIGDKPVSEALKEISKINKVKVMGSYLKAKSV